MVSAQTGKLGEFFAKIFGVQEGSSIACFEYPNGFLGVQVLHFPCKVFTR